MPSHPSNFPPAKSAAATLSLGIAPDPKIPSANHISSIQILIVFSTQPTTAAAFDHLPQFSRRPPKQQQQSGAPPSTPPPAGARSSLRSRPHPHPRALRTPLLLCFVPLTEPCLVAGNQRRPPRVAASSASPQARSTNTFGLPFFTLGTPAPASLLDYLASPSMSKIQDENLLTRFF